MSLKDLITANSKAKVKDIFIPKVDFVTVDQKGEEVARIMSKYDLEAIPVVNKKNQLLGRITIDDVMDVANNNLTMPPKTTWFDPKPLDGLVVYEFE